jgi:ABC-type multidrug transport system fused ATPase/permease subunit
MDGGSTLLGAATGRVEGAFLLALVGLAASVAKAGGGVCATWAQGRIAGAVAAQLRLDVLDRWLARHRLRRPWHGDHGSRGAVGDGARGVAALTSRVRDVEIGLSTGLLGGARALTQLVPLAVLLVVISPKLAACAVAVLVPFGMALGGVRRAWKGATERAARGHEALLEAADEAVRHADLWRTYGAEAKARATVASLGRSLARVAAKIDASAAGLSGANEVLGAVALVAALGASRGGWLGPSADGGTLFAFALAFFLAYKPLRELTEARLALLRARGAMDELEPESESESESESEPEPEPDSYRWSLGALELRNVRLGHGRIPVLTARIEPGSIVAIAGPTGVGKTTLLRALLGLDALLGGEIRYAGVPLTGGPGPAARPFAWVPQEAPLLADTLDANVRLGPGARGAEEALALLGASHLVGALGDARLGAGGRAVSGGERQWIGLARAIATEQPVLLLDEPTSGLDAASQARVLEAIAKLRGERTVVLVTHRREPLAIADAVIRV